MIDMFTSLTLPNSLECNPFGFLLFGTQWTSLFLDTFTTGNKLPWLLGTLCTLVSPLAQISFWMWNKWDTLASTMVKSGQKCLTNSMKFERSVWILPKMSHLSFWILAFSANICNIKSDLSGNTVWLQTNMLYKLIIEDSLVSLPTTDFRRIQIL